MTRVLVIGATSAIAEQCARIWATRGDDLYLVGRNEEHLARVAADLTVRGARSAGLCVIDLNDIAAHAAMLDRAEVELGALDIVLIAHGTLPDQRKCELDVELTIGQINTNALSVVSLLTLLANKLERQQKGTITVISSVAGDRGRRSNYVYGSAKAMVTAFTSGLRQRLHGSGVNVLTIKPGFVDTPMTSEFEKNFMWAKAESVARTIVKACDGSGVVYTPAMWWAIMTIIKLIPEAVFKRMSL
jgi:decaprenylphospho-beta-D-erythro-pentofuranosid-2-ulose 2-reductase